MSAAGDEKAIGAGNDDLQACAAEYVVLSRHMCLRAQIQHISFNGVGQGWGYHSCLSIDSCSFAATAFQATSGIQMLPESDKVLQPWPASLLFNWLWPGSTWL